MATDQDPPPFASAQLVVGHGRGLSLGPGQAASINFDPAQREMGPIKLDPGEPDAPLWVQFSNDGQHIRRWAAAEFEGGTRYDREHIESPGWPHDARFYFGQLVKRRDETSRQNPKAKIAGWARRDDGRLAYVVEHANGLGRCAVIHERDLEPRSEIPA